jgi:hypothetical protein
MTKLTVEQDMKLGSALDQLEDSIEAAYAALKMVEWSQINVARFAGSVIAPELNPAIRSIPLDVDQLWRLAQTRRSNSSEAQETLLGLIETHNQKILDLIIEHNP